MKLNSFKKNTLDYIVVDDVYTSEELKSIKAELQGLVPHAQPVEVIGSGRDDDNQYKKNCLSLWADIFFKEDRTKSDILRITRKIFCDEITSFATKTNAFFDHIRMCNMDSTLINYYKTGEQYKSHTDKAPISILTFIELGKVNGGGLIFTDFNEFISFKDNRMVIFPGCVEHKTESIITDINSYRVSIAQFIGYRLPQ
jgi:hypothetical protein